MNLKLPVNASPKNPISSLPYGYTEEKLSKDITNMVIMALTLERNLEQNIETITSSKVRDLSLKYTQELIREIARRHTKDIEKLGEKNWDEIKGMYTSGFFTAALIFREDKNIRRQVIRVPIGKQYEKYLDEEIIKSDSVNEYKDELIPPYLFQSIKDLTQSLYSKIISEKTKFLLKETSEEFRTSILIQFIYLLSSILSAYLIQDSFLKDH